MVRHSARPGRSLLAGRTGGGCRRWARRRRTSGRSSGHRRRTAGRTGGGGVRRDPVPTWASLVGVLLDVRRWHRGRRSGLRRSGGGRTWGLCPRVRSAPLSSVFRPAVPALSSRVVSFVGSSVRSRAHPVRRFVVRYRAPPPSCAAASWFGVGADDGGEDHAGSGEPRGGRGLPGSLGVGQRGSGGGVGPAPALFGWPVVVGVSLSPGRRQAQAGQLVVDAAAGVRPVTVVELALVGMQSRGQRPFSRPLGLVIRVGEAVGRRVGPDLHRDRVPADIAGAGVPVGNPVTDRPLL